MEKVFIDSDIKIFKGEEASKLLSEKNDKEFLKEGSVKKVSDERWREAQEYEKNTWCFSPARGMSTDRNEDHRSKFGGYRLLNMYLKKPDIKMIELGSGPFTNLRLIIPEIFKPISQVDLLDPLLDDYIKHTVNCTFKDGYLSGRKVNLINSPIEDFKVEGTYDLIVMMNVLEHCKDVDLIFEKILQMMDENSIFLFHDVSIDDNKVDELISNHWDCGHPILLSQSYIREKLKNFKVIYKNADFSEKNEMNTFYYILKK